MKKVKKGTRVEGRGTKAVSRAHQHRLEKHQLRCWRQMELERAQSTSESLHGKNQPVVSSENPTGNTADLPAASNQSTAILVPLWQGSLDRADGLWKSESSHGAASQKRASGAAPSVPEPRGSSALRWTWLGRQAVQFECYQPERQYVLLSLDAAALRSQISLMKAGREPRATRNLLAAVLQLVFPLARTNTPKFSSPQSSSQTNQAQQYKEQE